MHQLSEQRQAEMDRRKAFQAELAEEAGLTDDGAPQAFSAL